MWPKLTFGIICAGMIALCAGAQTGLVLHVPQTTGYGTDGESGGYTYDSSGNITAIGADTFVYDSLGRLRQATVRSVHATYMYDEFGNRKTATGETNCLAQTVCATPVTIDPAGTNHLAGGVAYDAAGSVITGPGGEQYTYDGTGMMTRATVGADDRQFVYTADDERIAVRQGVSWTWTVRDRGGKVLREFTSAETSQLGQTNRQWVKDYVWRDGLLLATTSAAGTNHFHLDHLGTPRLVTNAAGTKMAEHAYYPFGAEIDVTPHESPEEAMKYTGHERDLVAGDGHTLDYMHARYFAATVGRFLSPDSGRDWNMHEPQSWNLYTYAGNNPLHYVDETGADKVSFFVKTVKGIWREVEQKVAMRAARRGEQHAVRVVGRGASGRAERLAKLAHEGEDIIRHDAHIPEGDPHYQPRKGSGGQIGYDIGVFIVGLIPVVGWFADADPANANEDVRMDQIRASMIALEDYGKPFDLLTPEEKQKVWAEATGQQPREAPKKKKKDDPDEPDPNDPKKQHPDKWQY